MSKIDIQLIKKAQKLRELSKNLDEKIFININKEITDTEVLDKLIELKNNSEYVFNNYLFSNKRDIQDNLESIYFATVHLLYSLS